MVTVLLRVYHQVLQDVIHNELLQKVAMPELPGFKFLVFALPVESQETLMNSDASDSNSLIGKTSSCFHEIISVVPCNGMLAILKELL